MEISVLVNETSDVFLAAFLFYEGYPLRRLDTSDAKRFTFVFEDSEALRDSVRRYWERRARVEPGQFGRSLREAKDYIFDARRRMEKTDGKAR